MSEYDPDFVSSALNIPKYRFMMILLSAVSLFYLMCFYIIKSQTEKTLQKIKKNISDLPEQLDLLVYNQKDDCLMKIEYKDYELNYSVI